MSLVSRMKQEMRRHSEQALRRQAIDELRREHPDAPTAEPYRNDGGVFWERVFAPAYRAVPWSAKQAAMKGLGMTARGWSPPPRRFPGDPWQLPADAAAKATSEETA